ncbi:hypothetical protein [Dyella sp. S184]|uniref:hypothetical protein n=1 Tax=Dyella sp. S184 TaxID=1641862 RepID=UPI00131B0D69|nr:hypothetical protein [Dyella sp. S184]
MSAQLVADFAIQFEAMTVAKPIEMAVSAAHEVLRLALAFTPGIRRNAQTPETAEANYPTITAP